MHSAERFFLIGALSDYSGHRKLDADDVTREVALMRAAFTNLGYTEIEPPEEDRRGPVELEQALEDWVTEREATSRDGDRASLVVYYTGHGVVSTPNTLFLPSADATPPPPGKPVTPSARFVPAANLASWALNTHVLDDFLLIVDTCMSGTAGLNIVKLEAEASGTSGRGPNLWVISAARRLENAEVGKFAEAFTASLASAEGNQEQIDITKFVGVINEHLDTASQQANLIALTNNTCGLLLDPHHMPRQLPDGLVSWVGSARGVEAAEQPGWYFTGRREALAAIDEHLGDDRPGPLVITGSRGSGKTALLRWTQITTSRGALGSGAARRSTAHGPGAVRLGGRLPPAQPPDTHEHGARSHRNGDAAISSAGRRVRDGTAHTGRAGSGRGSGATAGAPRGGGRSSERPRVRGGGTTGRPRRLRGRPTGLPAIPRNQIT
ncbi:hypothetical protein ACVDFE_15690 [Lentzea chajnantorensis]